MNVKLTPSPEIFGLPSTPLPLAHGSALCDASLTALHAEPGAANGLDKPKSTSRHVNCRAGWVLTFTAVCPSFTLEASRSVHVILILRGVLIEDEDEKRSGQEADKKRTRRGREAEGVAHRLLLVRLDSKYVFLLLLLQNQELVCTQTIESTQTREHGAVDGGGGKRLPSHNSWKPWHMEEEEKKKTAGAPPNSLTNYHPCPAR